MKNFQLWQDNEDISLIFLVPNTYTSHLYLLALSFFMLIYEYFKFAGFMKDDVVYIDFTDVMSADFDYVKLAENKGISL